MSSLHFCETNKWFVKSVHTYCLRKSFTHLTLASLVAMTSHDASSISPWGSTNLTPLSGSSLCDAVIMTPIVARE